MQRTTYRRRVVRYGLIVFNLLIVAGILVLTINNAHVGQAADKSLTLSVAKSVESSPGAMNPLDQLSSADIAVNLARLANMSERTAVANQADSVAFELTVSSSGNAVIPKPQIVSTSYKSRRDIKTYVVQQGDTVTSIAEKFGVTPDSVRWSNDIGGDAVSVGARLAIPPVNGIVYTVVAGDTPNTVAQKYRANLQQLIAYNDAELTGLKVGEQILIPNGQQPAPAVAAVSSYYASGFAWGTSAVYGFNGYDPGWCTWYAATRRAQLGRPVPSNLGNAYSWASIAASAGLPTGAAPAAGAVMVNSGGDHVAVVEKVNPDGSFWISEMNSSGQRSMSDPTPTGGLYTVDWKVVRQTGAYRFIY